MTPMPTDFLKLYRRHAAHCLHRDQGQNYTLCECPIYVYGVAQGKDVRQSLGTTDLTKAQAELRRFAQKPRELTTRVPSLAEAIERYLTDCQNRNLAEGTRVSYKQTLLAFADFSPPHLAHITPDDVAALRDRGTREPRTRLREIVVLRTFLKFCVKRGWLEKNPADAVGNPQIPDSHEFATVPYAREEVDLLQAAADGWEATLQRTLLYTGLRIIDIARLRRTALEPSGHLRLYKIAKKGIPVKVKLPASLAQALRRLPAWEGNPDYFFWDGKGTAHDHTKFLRAVILRIGQRAGVHATPHRYRDTFAVELVSKGTDLRTVQKLMGHRSIRITEKYAHFSPAEQHLLDAATAGIDFEQRPATPLIVDSLHG